MNAFSVIYECCLLCCFLVLPRRLATKDQTIFGFVDSGTVSSYADLLLRIVLRDVNVSSGLAQNLHAGQNNTCTKATGILQTRAVSAMHLCSAEIATNQEFTCTEQFRVATYFTKMMATFWQKICDNSDVIRNFDFLTLTHFL